MSALRDWITNHSATSLYTAFVVSVILLMEIVKL